jgi:ribonucleoside-triphosphate reductase (formate)
MTNEGLSLLSVRKRDGRVVPFEKGKIVVAIYKALQSTGQDDRLLAQEMAEAVTIYLQKSGNTETPDIETIQDAVERVLIEMKLYNTAKAYILYRDKRARLRDAVQEAKGARVVQELRGENDFRWDRERVIRALANELRIPRLVAERIADVIEETGWGASGPSFPPDQLDLSIH